MDVLLITCVVVIVGVVVAYGLLAIAIVAEVLRRVPAVIRGLGGFAIVLGLLALAGWCCYTLWTAGHDNLGVSAALIVGGIAVKLAHKFVSAV